MPTIQVHEFEGAKVAAELLAKGVEAAAAIQAVTLTYGNMLLSRVKSNASGRPGPRIVTGNYNRSWSLKMSHGRADVGTNAPQGRRLEFGFVGTDSLGRTYNQPPYPHARPALDAIAPLYYAALSTTIGRIMR